MFRRQKNKLAYKKIIGGVIFGLAIMIAVTFLLTIFSALLNNYSLLYRQTFLLIVNLVIIILTGFMSARSVTYKGWLHGACSGFLFTGLILLVGSFNLSISAGVLFLLLFLGMILGSIGGIIGVNFQ